MPNIYVNNIYYYCSFLHFKHIHRLSNSSLPEFAMDYFSFVAFDWSHDEDDLPEETRKNNSINTLTFWEDRVLKVFCF